MHKEGVKYNYAHYLLFQFHQGRRSVEKSHNCRANRPHPMYLGGVLVLTRIVYYAMGKINILPPPLHIPHGVIPTHSTRPQAQDRPTREPAPQKEMPKRHTKEEVPRRATRSGERMAKKAAKSSPPSSSPSDKDDKRFEEELAKAMDISKKEMKKGNETK